MSHRMEHELGGMFDVTHGAGLAAIWPSWARYVYRDCLPRFVQFARNVMEVPEADSDEATALRGIEAMEVFYRDIGMPTTLGELGVHPTEAQMQEMAQRCVAACGARTGSAKHLTQEDMVRIYQMASR